MPESLKFTTIKSKEIMSKLLVVEDDITYIKAYSHKFVLEGFEVEVAGDGTEALMILKDYKPDLMVVDLMMPQMSGYEFLQVVKKEPSLKSVPVLILTNSMANEDIGKVMGSDPYRVMGKADNDPDTIVAAIKELLKTPLKPSQDAQVG